jgi:hypothetical protein
MAENPPPYDYSAANLVRTQPPLISVPDFQEAVTQTIKETNLSFLDKLRCTEDEETALDVEYVSVRKPLSAVETIFLDLNLAKWSCGTTRNVLNPRQSAPA